MMMVVAVLCIFTVVASGAVAAAETQSTDEEILEDELNETDTNSTIIADSSTTEGDEVVSQEVDDVDVAVAVAPPSDSSFASDSTVDIWVGAFDDNGETIEAVEDEVLEVTVEEPNGTAEFNATTGEDGNDHLEYEPVEDGTYTVEVTREDDGASASINFDVGPVIDVIDQFSTVPVLAGEETQFYAVVREGASTVADENVEFTIETQDGEQLVEETATNEAGIAEVTYETEEADNSIDVTAEIVDGIDTDSDGWSVDEVIGVNWRFGEYDFTAVPGEETVFTDTLLTTDGPLVDEEITIRIVSQSDDGVYHEENVTTDDGGFFFVEYELPEDDHGDIEAIVETQDGDEILTRDIDVESLDEPQGFVEIDDDIEADDDEFTVETSEFENLDPDTGGFIVVSNEGEEVTLNNIGEATVTVDTANLGELEDGDTVSVTLYESPDETNFLSSDDTVVGDQIVLDTNVDVGDTEDWGTTAPGGEVSVNITATEDDEPVSNETVEIYLSWDDLTGWSASPPLFTDTVTTDDEGEASVTITIPEENALDGVNPTGKVAIEHEGEINTDRFDFDIEEKSISFSTSFSSTEPGEEGTISLDATDQLTGDPIAGGEVAFAANYRHRYDIIQTGQITTDDAGNAEIDIEIPSDVGPRSGVFYVHKYSQVNWFRNSPLDHSGELEMETAADDDDAFIPTVTPGEEVELDFDVETNETVEGIAIGDDPEVSGDTYGSEISSDEPVTVTIPEYATESSFEQIEVWAQDSDGQFYNADVRFDIEEPEGAVADFDVTTPPVGPIVGEELTFDASDSTATEGSLTYEWDFDDGTELETDDPVVTHTYDSSEDVTVELTVTDEAGESDTTTQTITVRDATTITGELTHYDGESPNNNTVLAFDTTSGTIEGAAVTDEEGEFELLAAEPFDGTPGDVRIAYYQGELPDEEPDLDELSELDAFPRDDRVDLFALDVVDRNEEPVDLGQRTLPEGYVVNPTVVENGEPVADALLRYEDINEETGAWVDWLESTNDDGQGLTGGEPGFELNGTVEIHAWSPDNNLDDEPDAIRELDVTEDTSFEIELNATPPEAELEAPEEVNINENFELNASDSSDEVGIDTFEFTVTNEDGDVVFEQQTTGENATVSTNLTDSGVHTAAVTVENEDGLTDSAEVNITVLDEEPNLVAEVEAQDEQRIEDDVNATITVSNDGTANITEPVEVEVSAEGSLFESDEVVSENTTLVSDEGLAAGGSFTEEESFNTTTADDERIVGDVDIDVEADPDDEIDEATTLPNTDSTTVEVTYANLVADANARDSVEQADTRFRSFIRNTGTANSSESTATVSVTNETNVTVFEEDDVQIDSLEPGDRQRGLFNDSFEAGEYELTVDVEDEQFPENTTDNSTFDIDVYNLSTVENATDVQPEVQAGLNTTVIFGFETNSQEPVNATLDTSDADALSLSDSSQTETVTVDPETDRANLVAYDVQGLETANDTELTFNVSDTIDGLDESESTSETTNVTVRTETITNESSATLEEDDDDAEATLEAFANNDTTDQELAVTVQAGTEGRTLEGLGYLVNYPYGCVEQTTSAFLGALNTDEYYDDRDEDVTPDQQDDINGSIEEGIERLEEDGLRGQQDDGSWNQWGREDQAGQSYFSSYALLGVSSVENNELHSDLNEDNLESVDFDAAVEWLDEEESWNDVDGYLYDEPASIGFTLVALDEVAETNELDAAENNLTNIYADAAVELNSTQEDVDDGVAWNDENPRSTALAVHGLQLAVEHEAYEERDELNETDLNETIDEGVDWLLTNQNDDGSWDEYNPSPWFNNEGDKSETTSAALMALHETGMEAGDEEIVDGTDYLIDVYESDGSWGYPRATQASINALNELTPGAADRTVDITIDVENGGEETFEDISVNSNTPTQTVDLDNEALGDILDDTEQSEITVEIDAENGGEGMLIVATEVTQDVEGPALGGDDE